MNSSPDIFNLYRQKLMGVAYRMLGSRADAEDVLQDAYIRWLQSDVSDLRSAEAWLVTVVSRLSIDRLRVVKKERESYIGQWLPEPWVTENAPSAEQSIELAGDISIAFLMMLERLSLEERAAFLLHEIFELEYAEIAQLLDKNQDACRQLVHRAKGRVRQERPRFEVNRESHIRLLEKFIQASRTADRMQLMELFAEDVSFMGDGGGKVPSVLRMLRGAWRVLHLYQAIKNILKDRMEFRIAEINGAPGILRYVDGNLESTTSVVTNGAQILEIYVVRNPDKLRLIELRSI